MLYCGITMGTVPVISGDFPGHPLQQVLYSHLRVGETETWRGGPVPLQGYVVSREWHWDENPDRGLLRLGEKEAPAFLREHACASVSLVRCGH